MHIEFNLRPAKLTLFNKPTRVQIYGLKRIR